MVNTNVPLIIPVETPVALIAVVIVQPPVGAPVPAAVTLNTYFPVIKVSTEIPAFNGAATPEALLGQLPV